MYDSGQEYMLNARVKTKQAFYSNMEAHTNIHF